MGKRLARYGFLLSISSGLIALDQASKAWVRSRFGYGESWVPIEALGEWLRIVNWSNTGAAFGFLPSGGILFAVIASIVIGGILFYWPHIDPSHRLLRLALALQFSGALGNLIDRIHQGTVTDFIAVGRFPVFNVADASISLGLVLLLIGTWLESPKRKEGGAQSGSMGDEAEVEMG